MAASDHLNTDLFHGTGGAIEGGVVNPSKNGAYGPGAYATDLEEGASWYAERKARAEGRLFGTVYRVNPISENLRFYRVADDANMIADPKGLQVVEAVSYPLNSDVAR